MGRSPSPVCKDAKIHNSEQQQLCPSNIDNTQPRETIKKINKMKKIISANSLRYVYSSDWKPGMWILGFQEDFLIKIFKKN